MLSGCTTVEKCHDLVGLNGQGWLSRQNHPWRGKMKVVYYLRLAEITFVNIEFSRS